MRGLCLVAILLVAGPVSAQGLDPSDPGFWAISGVTLLAAWHLDSDLRLGDPALRDGLPRHLASAGYRLGGSSFLVPAFASAIGFSHVTGWPAETQRVLHVAAGAAAAGVVAEAIKTTVGRSRPRDGNDPRSFNSFTRDNAFLAFPSGHTVAGFAVAAALDREFDLGIFAPVAYGTAGLIAWSRVYADAHWTSDAVAGAIVGIVVSRGTVSWLQTRSGQSLPAVRVELHTGQPVLAVTVPVR